MPLPGVDHCVEAPETARQHLRIQAVSREVKRDVLIELCIYTGVTNVIPTQIEVLEPMTIAAKHCNQGGNMGETNVATNTHQREKGCVSNYV